MMLHWPLNEIAAHSTGPVYRVDEMGQNPSEISPFQWSFKERSPDFSGRRRGVYNSQYRMQADLSITNHCLYITGNALLITRRVFTETTSADT